LIQLVWQSSDQVREAISTLTGILSANPIERAQLRGATRLPRKIPDGSLITIFTLSTDHSMM
jgi:hypothetical protein